ncbi:MAG: hypothetical protein ACI9XO_000065 [Paraglaciecola sp.]
MINEVGLILRTILLIGTYLFDKREQNLLVEKSGGLLADAK